MRSARPDPEVRRLLCQLALAPSADPARTFTPAAARRRWQLAVKAFASREPVAAVTDHEIAGPGGVIRLRAYRPEGVGPFGVLVWLHGGGFVVGDLYTAGATARALANRSGAVVVAVQYRLVPENSLDAGYADCLTAVEWAAGHAVELGGTPGRLAVGGDSAGGGFAALVAQECLRRGIPLAAQLLVYPATDLTGSTQSTAETMPGPLSLAWLDWLRGQIRSVSDLFDPKWSALRAADLAGVAPAVVLTAGFDPLRDEGIAYARALAAAGVQVRHLHYPGQIHGFVALDRVLTGGRDALDRLGAELGLALTGGPIGGVDLDLPPGRDVDRLLWLSPRQRWHELIVAAVLVRDRLGAVRGRKGRSDQGSAAIRAVDGAGRVCKSQN